MNTRGGKAKGRRLQNWVAAILKEVLELDEDHIRPALMSEGGEDVKLSKVARAKFPYSIECKNQEQLKGLYKFYGQAVENANGNEPLLIMKRNHEKPLAVVDAEYFLRKFHNG